MREGPPTNPNGESLLRVMRCGKEHMRKDDKFAPNTSLCERLISLTNITRAVDSIASGSQDIESVVLKAYFDKHFATISRQIITRTFTLKSRQDFVTQTKVPSVVVGRVLQQALVQILIPVFEPTFSSFSFGCIPRRSSEQASQIAQNYISQGYRHVVRINLSNIIESLDHDILLGLIDKHMEDKDIRRLMYEFLKNGIMAESDTRNFEPLIPLLTQIYLTPYDRELEQRGLHFVRLADKCDIFTRSKMSSYRVRDNAKSYLERKLKLKVNVENFVEAGDEPLHPGFVRMISNETKKNKSSKTMGQNVVHELIRLSFECDRAVVPVSLHRQPSSNQKTCFERYVLDAQNHCAVVAHEIQKISVALQGGITDRVAELS